MARWASWFADWRRDRRHVYVASALLVALGVVALASVSFFLERDRYRERASVATRNVANLLNAQVSGDFRKVDLAIGAFAGMFQRSSASAPIAPERMQQFVEELKIFFPELESVSIIDADGFLRYSTSLPRNSAFNVADRDYFIKARNNPGGGLVIDGPLRSRFTDRWLIVFARPLQDAQGRFAGAIFASLSQEYFRKVLQSVDLGSHGAATIRTADLALVFRNPAPNEANIGSRSVSAELKDIVEKAPTGGDYIATTVLDGIERSNAYRRIEGYPFYVLVGRATVDYLGDWRRNMMLIALFSGLLIATVMLSSRALYRAARRQSEAARVLAVEANRFQTVLRTATVGIHVLDRQGGLVLGNPAFFRLIGRDESALPTLVVDTWDAGAESAVVHGSGKDDLPGEGEVSRFNTCYRRPNGDVLDVEVSMCRFRLDAEDLFVVSAHDVTEKNRALETLEVLLGEHRKLNEELALRVHQAEAANRAKDTFLTNMSHELRTPLNGIMGMLQLVLRRQREPEQAGRLEKAMQASRHLLAIITDLLDISRINAGTVVLDTAEFTLDQVLDQLRGLTGLSAQEKGLALHFETPPELGRRRLRCDRVRFEQVLLNLVNNAIKFTPSGSVTVRLAAAEETAQGVTLRGEVRDTGIGISAPDQERIFQAFEQVDASLSRQYGGVGLGLSISKRLVELMGGDIGVSSEAGQGTTFWFTLRLSAVGGRAGDAPAPAGTAQPASVHDESALRTYFRDARLLVAEDDPMHQEFVRELLADVGLRVTVVGDGVAAVEMAAQADFDLILMDLQMPHLDGISACRRIRGLPNHGRTRILGLTANPSESVRVQSLAAGMDDVLVKPISASLLLSSLAYWLSLRDERAAPASAL